MSQEPRLGLQWKLVILYLAAGLFSSGVVAAGYLAGTYLGLQPTSALGAGLAAGVAVGLTGSVVGSMIARSLKLRLWEAGLMAGRIARGDFQARLSVGPADEIGWLEEQLNQMAGHLETAVAESRALAEQNRRLAEEAGRGAALEERTRLARDLHDTVNQRLFALAMRAAAARRRLEQIGGQAAAVAADVAAIEDLARQAHSQTRELILQLRPVALDQQGLGPALREYVTAAGDRESWEVVQEIDVSIRLAGPTGESLFRVAQEALNNASKHAGAGRVWVRLCRTTEGILLAVKDDGVGFDLRAGIRPTAVGLIGIRERVAAMRGKLDVNSAPGRGTEITAVVPVPAKGGEAT